MGSIFSYNNCINCCDNEIDVDYYDYYEEYDKITSGKFNYSNFDNYKPF